MRILLTGSLVFLLWAIFSSWFYVCKIKPYCEKPAESVLPADTTTVETSPPVTVEVPKPQPLILFFDYNKTEMKTSDQTEQQSALIHDWMTKHPDTYLNITGHADSKGSNAYNQSLGMKRALTTQEFLKSKGFLPEKMKTESNGEEKPVADNGTEEGRAKNRRVEIIIN